MVCKSLHRVRSTRGELMAVINTNIILDEDELEIETYRIRDVIASDIVETQMTEYSRDLISRQYPHVMDGLKKVQRRIIWIAGNSTELVGLNAMVSAAESIHTSGDQSIYKALVRIAQDFNVGRKLVHIEGASGNYADENAAAPRYIDARISEFAKDLFFNRCIVDTLPMNYTKNFKSKEPQYFIPCIPSALILNHSVIGIGFNSISPQLNLTDVCDLVLKTVDCKTKSIRPFLSYRDSAKYLIPDFPIDNYLMNSKQQLLEEYAKGNFETPIYVGGKLILKDSTIIIKSIGFGNSFLNQYNKLTEKLKNERNKFWLFDMLKTYANLSTKEPNFVVSFKNNVDLFEILSKFKIEMSVNNVIHPNFNYNRNDRLVKANYIQLLEIWYKERIKSILSGVKYRHNELTLRKLEESARYIICENTDLVINILKNSNDENHAIRNLLDEFPKLTQYQAKILAATPVSRLVKSSKQDSILKLEKLELAIEEVLNRYTNLDETIYNDALFMKKKYHKPRITTFIEDQMGYVCINNSGIIQFTNPDELYSILQDNSKITDVKCYHDFFKDKLAFNKNKIIKFKHKGIYKEFAGDKILELPDNPITFVCSDDNKVSVVPGVKIPKEDDNFTEVLYTTRNFYGIFNDGKIIKINSKDLSNRKTLSKGSKSSLIYALPSGCKDIVIIHMHEMDPNVVRFDRIRMNGDVIGKCNMLPAKGIHILDVQNTNTNFLCVMVPPSCIYKSSINYLVVENMEQLFSGKSNSFSLQINKRNSGVSFKKHPIINGLMILKLRGHSDDDE